MKYFQPKTSQKFQTLTKKPSSSRKSPSQTKPSTQKSSTSTTSLQNRTLKQQNTTRQLQTLFPESRTPTCPQQKKKKKKKWRFQKSMFAKWLPDNEELVTLCFEYDWETGKMNKWLKEEEEFVKVKNFFRSKYQYLKDWYKFNACYNPIQDIWAIQNLAFTEFINKINIIDPKISAAQINVKWTAVISSAKGMNTIPASVILNNMKPQEFTYVGFQQDLEKQELHYPHHQKPEDYKEQYSQRDETKPEVIVIPPEMRIERKEGNFLRNLAQYTDPNALLGQKSNRNPPNGLNRYQVMDIIYKLAEEKYIQEYKTTKSISEAIKMLWDEHLKEEMTSYSSQVWRIQRYWNEKCDTVLKGYKKIIDNVYKDYSKKKVKPGQPPFMCLDELQNICIQMGLDELDHWSSSEHLFSFNLSMMTQVDELCSDRIFQMSLVEFYEAIGRLAEKASFLPLEGVPDLENLDNESKWPLSKRKELPLGYKMEGFIMVMLQRCCSPLFKQNMPKYNKSIFWVDPDESDYDLV
ncbi:hypothetical protein PPERSA_02480 [Pseudocohnilembus persalinus]|uniref:Uncharacterized protein n=1 Tax=Pseudocohnilembus persalinus TaxID=266149 RepID=A0A0V0QAY2_PSEPJ|nr:hypothetical protein PPERSA_02480 [Pseudocohnilembus persalinus]|eukprot:KRW99368.1 hypothetical protein PPERSA_02480 [Pseudocohnilembus persalinus]